MMKICSSDEAKGMDRMKNFYKMYSRDIPDFLLEIANTKEMQRLQNIGMNCGCEYTSFPRFSHGKEYTRYIHSMGVALIIWHFTKNKAQTIAGLLHDIATPVFAHTIDFLNSDYEKQESTEEETTRIIEESKDIRKLLHTYDIALDDVVDYHQYPIADNDSPKLSADRLEYSIGNMVNYRFCTTSEVEAYYRNIVVGKNEYDETELVFHDAQVAIKFTKDVLRNSRVYFGDEDRFAMQKLADIITVALARGTLTKKDLYTTENDVIKKLISESETKKMWTAFSDYSTISIRSEKPMDNGWIKVSSKKRYIDPYVKGVGRVSTIDQKVRDEICEIQKIDFDYWINSV